MREYKFFLNHAEINDEPIGWDESKRKLFRSTEFNGLFVEYINDITFHGDGYTVILEELGANGYCTEIPVDIYYRCSIFDSFSLYFRGKIKVSEIEIDLNKCTAKCQIEDNTVDAIINNFKDTEVRFDATRTIGGESLSLVNQTVTVRDSLVFATTYSRTGYEVFDAFQYILNYISDNRITFVSDFFSTTVSDRGTSTIVFTNPGVDLIGAGNVVIVYKNAFNVSATLTIPKQGTVAATLNYIISQFNFNTVGNAQEKFYAQDYKYYNNITTNGTTTVTLLSDIPGFSITSVNVASTISNDSTILNGMKNLVFMTGNQLRNDNTQVPVVSFKELFDEMNKLFDLGMSITTTLGTTTLRIEPYIYFFENTNTINLHNVLSLKRRSSKDFAKDIIKVGDGVGGNRSADVGKQSQSIEWIVGLQCSDVRVDIKSSWIAGSSEIARQISSADDDNDEDIYLFECETGSLSTIRYHNTIYNTTGAAVTNYYAYNAHLTNFWKITNWFFNLKGDAIHETYVMTNTARIKILNEYEFDFPITFDIQQAMIADREASINFDNDIIVYSGFVKEIVIENKTGLSTFKLLST